MNIYGWSRSGCERTARGASSPGRGGTEIAMREGEPGLGAARGAVTGRDRPEGLDAGNVRPVGPSASGWVIETVVSPFHCLYQDALHFHTQSRLAEARSESEASRLARAAFVLYLASAESL